MQEFWVGRASCVNNEEQKRAQLVICSSFQWKPSRYLIHFSVLRWTLRFGDMTVIERRLHLTRNNRFTEQITTAIQFRLWTSNVQHLSQTAAFEGTKRFST